MVWRRLRVAVLAGVAIALVPAVAAVAAPSTGTSTGTSKGGAAAGPARSACPVLVESALPLEIAPILAAADVHPNPVWVDAGKGFWAGTVEGNRAIIAITGIGMVNSKDVTSAAFAHFGCFSAVVFSGTSGGDYIGDVMVPARWTADGKQSLPTSAVALSVLDSALSRPVPLIRSTPVGDPACTCQITGESLATLPVTVLHQPAVEVGGTGLSNDGFGGRALPCTPQASDILGCWPCRFPDTQAAQQTTNLATTVPPFLDPAFFLGYQSASAAPPGTYVSEDNETEAAFAVAAAHHVPYIGFRAASDGGGDPLGLPGYPAQFFVYRQLAADNAAATALAFLQAWHAA